MRRLFVLLVLGVLCSVAIPTHAVFAAPGMRLAFVRDGNLWFWEAGRERQFTKKGEVRSPRFSYDGRFVAYSQGGEVQVAGFDGFGPWVLNGALSFAWSPSDDTLAVTDMKGTWTVAMTAEGPKEPRPVNYSWSGVVWSPDGRTLAVSRTERRGQSMFEGKSLVGIVPRSGGEPRVILEENFPAKGEPVGGASPTAWSFDGEWLLLVRYGLTPSIAADHNEFAVISARGGKSFRLGVSPNPRWAVWDPTAPVILFVDGDGRSAWQGKQLRLASPPWTRSFFSLTPAGYADRDPAWRPGSGRYVVFTRSLAQSPKSMDEPAPGQAIYQMDVVHPQNYKVPGSEGGFGPFWGQGGTLLWFKAEKGSVALWQLQQELPTVLVRQIDLKHSYYGQWGVSEVLGQWVPPDKATH